MVPGHPFFNLDSRLSPQEIPYISFKPFKPWLIFASIFSLAASLYLDASDKHRLFSPVFYMAYCSVWSVLVWANYREKFAIIGSSHWWHRTRFVMPQNVRILVRSAENVSPWCAEELGLERVETISDYNEEGSIVYKFSWSPEKSRR
jgi:hypothetical protein